MTGQFGGTSVLGQPPVSVKIAGRDTITFPAIRDDAPEPCRCGSARCPDSTGDIPMPADTRALLSCGPGVVSKMWRARVANGQWEDIPAEADAGRERVHTPAMKTWRKIRNELDVRWHDIAAILVANPDVRWEPELAGKLHQAEEEMTAKAAELHFWVTGRAAELRREREAEEEAAS